MKITPQYQAAFGLYKVLLTNEDFLKNFRSMFDQVCAEWQIHDLHDELGKQCVEKYQKVRLLDTFFSDTIPESLLNDIIRKSVQYKYKVQILVLDPLSELAKARARSLGGDINPVVEINRALRSIRNAMLRPIQQDKRTSEKERLTKVEYIVEQLRDIKTGGKEYPVEVRFYNILTESPFYILHHFALKGQIKHQISAKDNPWLVFIDDLYQENDIYDFLLGNFDSIFEDSDEYPEVRLHHERDSCFLAWPYNETKEQLYTVISKVCNEFSLELMSGDQRPAERPMDTIRAEIQRAAVVIADVTTANPNVMFELGMAHELEKYLVILSKGFSNEIPFDVRDRNIIYYGTGSNEPLETLLIDFFSKLPEVCGRRFGRVRQIAKKHNFYFEHFVDAHPPVKSCEEAAIARRINLSCELKTIIIDSPKGIAAIDVCGNEKVSIEEVARELGCERIWLAHVNILGERLLVTRGTVCPFTPRVWLLRHLVSKSVIGHEYMYTNNGTRTGYLSFSPKLLLCSTERVVGPFGE